jgi:hypothetical protein
MGIRSAAFTRLLSPANSFGDGLHRLKSNVYTSIAPGKRRSAGFKAIHYGIKNHFLVGSYKDVPARRYEELLSFIERLDTWTLIKTDPSVLK